MVMPGRAGNISLTNDRVKFTGYLLEEEGGQDTYHAEARGYDPVIGRFTSRDPLTKDFPSWTPYHYVHNNPISLVDPTGMSADCGLGSETCAWLSDPKMPIYAALAPIGTFISSFLPMSSETTVSVVDNKTSMGLEAKSETNFNSIVDGGSGESSTETSGSVIKEQGSIKTNQSTGDKQATAGIFSYTWNDSNTDSKIEVQIPLRFGLSLNAAVNNSGEVSTGFGHIHNYGVSTIKTSSMLNFGNPVKRPINNSARVANNIFGIP
jgi:RHS repeat-associated protein